MFSEDDADLVDALQIAPRASWAAVGDLLAISPVTAAKRWQRLVDEGLAWVTVAPGIAARSPQCFAYVEITCPARDRLTVADTIAHHPLAVTVEVITGNADILVTIAASDLPTLSHYVLHQLSEIQGVLSTRLRVATRLYSHGGTWRLHHLPEATAAAFDRLRAEELAGPPNAIPAITDPETTKSIIAHLSTDGRMSYAELADRIGVSPTTTRRKMTGLLRSGAILLRADVSAQDAGWPVENYLSADVPVGVLRETARDLGRMRQARLTSTIAAGPHLFFSAWLRTVEEVHDLELTIAEQLPDVQIVERLLVLRVVKRMGRLIDPHGRAAGVVPINIWDDAHLSESSAIPSAARPPRPSNGNAP